MTVSIRLFTCAVVLCSSVACDAPDRPPMMGGAAPIDTLMGVEHGAPYSEVVASGLPLECGAADANGRVRCSSPGTTSDPGAYVLGFRDGVLQDMRMSLRGRADGVPIDSLRAQMQALGLPIRAIDYGDGVSLTAWANETLERYLICFPPMDGPATAGYCEVWVAPKGAL